MSKSTNKNNETLDYKNTEVTKSIKKNKGYKLSENVIRYAIKNSFSNAEAARFLNVSVGTYKKYAEMYIDEVTGLNLYELHKNSKGIGIKKGAYYSNIGKPKIKANRKITGKKLLEGEFLQLRPAVVKDYLIKDGYMEPRCSYCGFSQYRSTDKKYPLRLIYQDGDYTNRDLDNMKLVCHNCYFLYIDDNKGKGNRNKDSKKKRDLYDIDQERQMGSGATERVVYDDNYDYNSKHKN